MNTERETELLGIIMFLLDVINRYSVFFGLINREVEWVHGMWEDDKIKEKQDEVVEFLKNEHGINLKVITNAEAIEGNEDG